MTREQVDMRALAHAVREELAPDYPGVHIELDALPPAFGDATLIRQLLFNLLDNALKYSAQAQGPRVRIGADVVEGETVYVVRDNGVGFDMAHAGKLFEPFHRLHPDTRYRGDGIGLALASQIVQRHHGRIWAQAALGQGAAFHFTLGGAENKPSV